MFETMAFLSTCMFATIFAVLIVMNRKAAKESEADGSAADSDTSRPTA